MGIGVKLPGLQAICSRRVGSAGRVAFNSFGTQVVFTAAECSVV